MKIQYTVDIKAVTYKEYKKGAPTHLLEKGGRWQQAGEYGGFENMSFEPTVLADNHEVFACAPELLAMLESKLRFIYEGIYSTYHGDPVENKLYTEVLELINKAKGIK